ncbi:MAG: MBL fold metallo-hydrolase [Burkholderiales bacterium]
MITNATSGTNLHEIAPSVYRINTPVALPGGARFNFNQYLVDDDDPLLFHTGPRALLPHVDEAIRRVIPIERLRYVAFSHFEADECGSLNDLLAAAPQAVPVASRIAAMVSVDDVAIRPARALADGEILATGRHRYRWIDTPHVPHGWESGLMMELTTRTLFAGDLFTQGGDGAVPVTDGDILGPSESFRRSMDYYAHAPTTSAILERLAREEPRFLACMHGSAWRGDGGALLRALARALESTMPAPVPATTPRGARGASGRTATMFANLSS